VWTALVLTAVALLLLQVASVAMVGAMRSRGNIYVTIVAVSVLTAPVAFASDSVLFSTPLGLTGRLFLVVIHLTLGGFLFHFMTLPDRSVTLRMLVELLLAPGQALSDTELRNRYSVRTMIESRLMQLSSGRFIEIAPDGTITLIGKGLWFGRFVTGGRRLFGIASAN
jgi:hypothetical protein